MLKTILNLEGVVILKREQQVELKAGDCGVLGGCGGGTSCVDESDCLNGGGEPLTPWVCLNGYCIAS